MYCNRCCKPQEPAAQCIATTCAHLFCVPCAKTVFETGTVCPVCQHVVTKNTIKLVRVLADGSEELDLVLLGQTPEKIAKVSNAAVNFYLQQAQLSFKLKENNYKNKIQKLQQACKRKLEEVHKGYQEAKQRYYDAQEQKTMLAQDLEELQDKYGQKASQAKNLQERASQVMKENDELRARLSMNGGGYGRNNSPTGHHPVGAMSQQPHLYSHPPPGMTTPRAGQLVPYQHAMPAFPQRRLSPQEPQLRNHPYSQQRADPPGRTTSPLQGMQYRPGTAGILQPHINGAELQAPTLRGRSVNGAQSRGDVRRQVGDNTTILAPSGVRRTSLPGFPSSPSNLASM